MATFEDGQREPASDPELVGLVWVGAVHAVVVRWSGEPIVEHLASAVPPRRRAVGSVDADPPDRPAAGACRATGRRSGTTRSRGAS